MMKVLVCIDLEHPTQPIVDALCDLAASVPISVSLLHVTEGQSAFGAFIEEPDFADDPTGVGTAGIVPDEQTIRDAKAAFIRDERHRLSGLAEELHEAGIDAKPIVAEGDPVDTILEHQGQFEPLLTLVGSRRHGVVHDLVVGSVTRDLLRSSTRMIACVPIHDANDGA